MSKQHRPKQTAVPKWPPRDEEHSMTVTELPQVAREVPPEDQRMYATLEARGPGFTVVEEGDHIGLTYVPEGFVLVKKRDAVEGESPYIMARASEWFEIPEQEVQPTA
jgi:hypothetical protein